MSTVIDTLRYSEKLRSAGFVTEQANALAWALNDEVGEQLATKSDIKEVNRKIEDLRRTIEITNEEVKKSFEGVYKTFEATNKTFEMKFEVLNMKIENLESRFNFLFGLIALLVVLELIPVVKPLFG